MNRVQGAILAITLSLGFLAVMGRLALRLHY